MDDDNKVTTIKVVNFDGTDEEKWRSWAAKSKAIGTLNGWAGCLQKDETVGIDEDTTDEGELKRIKNERNAQMYLTLACSDNAFEYIIGKTSAQEMWMSLKERFEPEEVDDSLELSQRFHRSTL